MYGPEVDIQSNFNDGGILIEQIALINDKKGNTPQALANDVNLAEEAPLNFGVTKESIPTNIEEQIDPGVFDHDLLALLKNFDNDPTFVQGVAFQNTSKVIENKLSQEIPIDDLTKL